MQDYLDAIDLGLCVVRGIVQTSWGNHLVGEWGQIGGSRSIAVCLRTHAEPMGVACRHSLDDRGAGTTAPQGNLQFSGLAPLDLRDRHSLSIELGAYECASGGGQHCCVCLRNPRQALRTPSARPR